MMRSASLAALMAGALGLLLLARPCPASETFVLFDGSPATAWDTGRDPGRLHREFSLMELKQASDPASLLWHFVSRGVGFDDIFLRREVPRRFLSIRVRLMNEGPPVTFSAKIGDADMAEWTPGNIQIAGDGKWQWVDLPWAKWQVASWSHDADGRMDFPLQYFACIDFGVKTGVDYRMRISRIEAILPDRPIATVSRLSLPSTMSPDRIYHATLSFKLDRPCLQDNAYLSFSLGGVEGWRANLPLPEPLEKVQPGKTVTVRDIAIHVPPYVRGGKYSAALVLGEAKVRGAGGKPAQEVVSVTESAAGGGIAAVKPHNGVPTLFIDGKPQDGMCYTAYGPAEDVFHDFEREGVHLYSFVATPTASGYGLTKTAWLAPGKYDFSQLDQRVMMVLQADPKAYFFPRLDCYAPKWWSAEHPDDCALYDPGDGKPIPFLLNGVNPVPCWASPTWREATVEGLRHLIAHIEAAPWGDRCIGYHLASGTTEEWMMWGANSNDWVGYSPANLTAFRHWLREKYGTDARLQAAWGQPGVTLDTAKVPTKVQRAAADFGDLRDPTREQQSIDYYLYNSSMDAGTICYLAHAVKEITHRQKIVGVFYGYLLQLCGEQRQQNAGHLALEKVLNSPDVDFLCSPTSYAFRELGGSGTSHFMSLLGSVHAHGKVWFDENDIRTSLSGGKVGEWGRAPNVAGDITQQQKELADVIVNGAAQWWFDVGGNKYNNPQLLSCIGDLVRSAKEAVGLNRAPEDKVAMVVDENSLCYLRVGDAIGRWFLVGQLPTLLRIGAPVGEYLVSDLPRIADHKLFLMMTDYAPTAQDRRNINALKSKGRVLVFFYAPGLYRDGKIDAAAMTDLTGIHLRLSTEPEALQVKLLGGDPLTKGLAGTTVGVEQKVSPVVYADDPDAKVLGTLPDGRPGLVVKRFPDWTAVFCAVPVHNTALLRNLAVAAGVHTYIDTPDVVWASHDLVAVSADKGGPRTIDLPRRASVTDLYTGKKIASDVTKFTADFEPLETRVFVVK